MNCLDCDRELTTDTNGLTRIYVCHGCGSTFDADRLDEAAAAELLDADRLYRRHPWYLGGAGR